MTPQDLWCVRTAYFTAESVARRYIEKHSAKAGKELLTEATGKGFIVRSRPLNFDDAYEFRAQARSSFASDAFIRRCERASDRRNEAGSAGPSSSELKSKPILKESIELPLPQIVEPKKSVTKKAARPTKVTKGERPRGPKDVWCVHTAYFALERQAQRDIETKASQRGAQLVIEATGKGFIIRSKPLSFDDAYDFRAEARASFSPDAYIRKCQ
jgi:hypothetical protein